MTKKFFMFAALLMTAAAFLTSCEKNDPYDAEIARVKAASQGDWVGELTNLTGDNEHVTVTFTETKVSTSLGVSANIVKWTCPDGKTWIELDDTQKTKLNIRVNGDNMELNGTTTFFLTNFPTVLTRKSTPSTEEIKWVCNATTLSVPLAGVDTTFTISCNQSWTARSEQEWITFSPNKGDANQTYTINVSVAAGEKAYGKIYFENANFPNDYWIVYIDRE